jgi:hypothetical protein
MRSEIVFPRASATGYHCFYVIRQIAAPVGRKIRKGTPADIVRRCAIDLHFQGLDRLEVELQHGSPRREFRSCCMMRWIFRLIVMTVAAKLVNRYLGDRHPQPRSRRSY